MRYTSLTRNNEFTRAYRRGKSFVHPFLVTYVFPRRSGKVRVGITSSKKIGGLSSATVPGGSSAKRSGRSWRQMRAPMISYWWRGAPRQHRRATRWQRCCAAI